MAGYLTIHGLGADRARPAAGPRTRLCRIDGAARRALARAVTAGRRTRAPIRPEADAATGISGLLSAAGASLRGAAKGGGADSRPPAFLGETPIRCVGAPVHDHVPLPRYATCRGS